MPKEQKAEEPTIEGPTVEERNAETLPKGAELLDDGSIHYVLTRPVSLEFQGGEAKELSDLTFRELTAGDLIDSSTGGVNAKTSLDMLQRCTGHKGIVGEKLLRAMSARDYVRCQKIMSCFLDDGETTGP